MITFDKVGWLNNKFIYFKRILLGAFCKIMTFWNIMKRMTYYAKVSKARVNLSAFNTVSQMIWNPKNKTIRIKLLLQSLLIFSSQITHKKVWGTHLLHSRPSNNSDLNKKLERVWKFRMSGWMERFKMRMSLLWILDPFRNKANSSWTLKVAWPALGMKWKLWCLQKVFINIPKKIQIKSIMMKLTG